MTDNPIQVPKGSIFICGDFDADPKTMYANFNEVEEVLTGKGFNVINGAVIQSNDTNIAFRQKQTLKQRMAYLAMCDVIMILENWSKNEEAKVLCTAARLLGKKVEYFRSY